MSRVKKVFAVACSSAMLAAVPASTASAQVAQDGLVNVNVGDVTVQAAVPVSAAVNAVVQACDLADVGNVQVAVLARARAVDRNGQEQTICRSGDLSGETGPVSITQNSESG
jgi:hypothetical protein